MSRAPAKPIEVILMYAISMQSLQDRYAPENRCFGCGPANEKGLRIKSFVSGEGGEVVAEWRAEPHHQAFEGVLMKQAGASTPPSTVTADFHVTLKRPTPMDVPITIRAKVVESLANRAVVEATLEAGGRVTAVCRGTFVAVNEGHPAYHRW